MTKVSIGKIAKTCDVKIDTIRYYEKLGLIEKPERTDSGYRMFDPSTVEVVKFIKNAQELGFSLDEIGRLIAMSKSKKADCGDVQEMALEKLEQIEEKIRGLKMLKKNLKRLASACPGTGTALNKCNILESLNG